MLRRAIPLARCVSCRGFFGPPTPRYVLEQLNRRFNDLEREFASNRWSPFTAWHPFVDHPTDNELFRIRNPIIEEDGVKKFKLEFDVRRFKPEVTTNKENATLTIEAKYRDDSSSFEYQRRVKIPEGVDPKSITAKFTADGTLVFEAPYTEPPKPEPPKDHPINIQHT